MRFLEKDLENIIYNTDRQQLIDRGLNVPNYFRKVRQLNIGNYGIADIVYFSRFTDSGQSVLLIEVLELKKEIIDYQAFHQAIRYVQGIRHFLALRNFNFPQKVRITLIGKEVSKTSSLSYVSTVFNNVGLVTYDYEYDGITFIERYFELANTGFNNLKLKPYEEYTGEGEEFQRLLMEING